MARKVHKYHVRCNGRVGFEYPIQARRARQTRPCQYCRRYGIICLFATNPNPLIAGLDCLDLSQPLSIMSNPSDGR